jgi:tRNA G18 (ribose-2'-O)-methylase SpoU
MTHHVTSLELPELQPYRTLRRPMDHIKEGIFVAEGGKVVQRLLHSDIPVVSALMTLTWYNHLMNEYPTIHERIPAIYTAEKGLVESIVGFPLHQGIMAVAKVPADSSLDHLLHSSTKPFLFVALDGLVNAENVGMAVRNCAAFGVHALISGETSSSPYLRRAVRNSMGAVFSVPIVHSTKLSETLRFLSNHHHTRIIAAHPHEDSSLYKADLTGNICIVMGNEGEGVSAEILSMCTDRIAIPMLNRTDSLNVASASAVFLYEASRQRQKK